MTVNEWITIIAGAVALLGQFALLVRAYIRVNDLIEWQKEVKAHLVDRTIHLDPVRDEHRWIELAKRLDKIDKRLDQLVQLEIKHRKPGDTDE